MSGLGERIRQYRQKNGISQEEFAMRMGVSRQSVSKWENDMALPELDRLLKMSEIFGISLDMLVKGDLSDIPEGENETNAYSDKTIAENIPLPPKKQIPTGQRNWGIGLCIGGAVLFFLLGLLGGWRTGLVVALLFVLPGIYCLTIRSHLGLWIGWTYFVILDYFLLTCTSGSRGMLLAAIKNPGIFQDLSPIALLISAGINLYLLVMMVCTLVGFRKLVLPRTKKEIVLTVAFFVARYIPKVFAYLLRPNIGNETATLTYFYIQSPLIDWITLTLLLVVLVRLAALLRVRDR